MYVPGIPVLVFLVVEKGFTKDNGYTTDPQHIRGCQTECVSPSYQAVHTWSTIIITSVKSIMLTKRTETGG